MSEPLTNLLKAPAERILYRDGQLLTARDLSDEKHRDDVLRWLHVRYLHRTWGIVSGYDVQKGGDDHTVIVDGGYAIDIEGRDVLSAETVKLAVPDIPGTVNYILTVGYREDSCARICLLGHNNSAHDDRPAFKWRRQQDVRFGPQIPLVNVKVSDGKIQGGLDFRVRRLVKRQVRPHIATGSTEPGKTGWQDGPPVPDFLPVSLLEVEVDTSGAGFTQTPMYFATLTGDFGGIKVPVPLGTWPSGASPSFFLNSYCFIAKATPSAFTYNVLVIGADDLGVAVTANAAELRKWALQWLGLQIVDGCPPLSELLRPFPLVPDLLTEVTR